MWRTVQNRRYPPFPAWIAATLWMSLIAGRTSAQTLRGSLQDATTGQPIGLALIILFSESGDSIDYAIANERGYFSITSREPGSFRLLASALGYRETRAGIFDLGGGGEITLAFRMTPAPLAIDSLVMVLDRPTFEHALVRNGFVRRFEQSPAHFVTPYDLEHTSAATTEWLLAGIPGLTVRPNGGLRSHLGDEVIMRGPKGSPCHPALIVDGQKIAYDVDAGRSLSSIVPLPTVAAVEVYRSPAEVPAQYDITRGPDEGLCGMLVFWTKDGR